MKLNKIFLGLLGAVALTVASCSGEDNSVADDGALGVYFSNELSAQFEISPDANTLNDVFVSRTNASEELTVSIITEQEDGSIYSIPTSVTFPAGEKTTPLPISYDPAQIEYGKYETITVKVIDPTTPWGISEYSFKIGVTDWGEWQPWNEAGTADYYYSGVLFNGDDPDLPFTYRQNVLNPNLYQFKLEHWGYDVDLIWNYDAATGIVSCPFTYTGYTHSTYGPEYVFDYTYYTTVILGGPDDGVYGYFDEEQGILACPVVYYDTEPWGAAYEYIYIDGYVRADYSAELSYTGIFTDASNQPFAVGTLTLGPDATGAKAVVVKASEDATAVAAAIAAGEIEAVDVEAGRIEVPIAADLTGLLQIVAVVIEEGEIKSVANANFEYYGGGASPWVSLGTGYYVDDFIVPTFNQTPISYAYEVEVQESTSTPGLYRLVNAYAPVAAAFGIPGGNTNIEIHAEDPQGVYFLEQSTGLDFGYGDVTIVSFGGLYVEENGFDLVKQVRPEWLGTLEDGIITLPAIYDQNFDENIQGYCFFGDYYAPGGINEAFALVLPTASESVKAKAKAKALATKSAFNKIAPKNKMSKSAKRVVTNRIARKTPKF